jgi:hypothetical protein
VSGAVMGDVIWSDAGFYVLCFCPCLCCGILSDLSIHLLPHPTPPHPADLLGRTIALAATTLTPTPPCALAPPCAPLNRYACGADPNPAYNALPHTCGSCLEQYKGVAGAANAPCVPTVSDG